MRRSSDLPVDARRRRIGGRGILIVLGVLALVSYSLLLEDVRLRILLLIPLSHLVVPLYVSHKTSLSVQLVFTLRCCPHSGLRLRRYAQPLSYVDEIVVLGIIGICRLRIKYHILDQVCLLRCQVHFNQY